MSKRSIPLIFILILSWDYLVKFHGYLITKKKKRKKEKKEKEEIGYSNTLIVSFMLGGDIENQSKS